MENASKALIIAGAILISIILIGIGVLLVQKGTDITKTGTSGMDSQKIQSFNSQFTAYEGAKKGSELKGLVNLVNASNASDKAHPVVLTQNGATPAGSTTAITSISQLTDSQAYNVTITYATATPTNVSGTRIAGPTSTTVTSEEGYVCGITISN